MVQQENDAMGEDRSSTCAEKKNYEIPCRHRHSSVISSCSEDAESESTSVGYPSTQDEERDEEFEYGPGIVNKLKTRYLSIALKQNRGTNMRRSCSMENLLDQDRSPKANDIDMQLVMNGVSDSVIRKSVVGNLKRAKSMDTLLLDLNSESPSVKELMNGDDKKQPKIIRKVDGGLNRTIPMICDEELPKPDTVKTYKRMFEPAESKRGSHCRRPPVLRASAKSSALAASKNNGVLSSQSAKVNGTSLKNKLSAKQVSAVKAQSNNMAANGVNGISKKVCVKDLTRPAYNGCHVVKASPIKMVSSPRDNKNIEKEMNNINRLLNNREFVSSKPDKICNGNSKLKDSLKTIPEKIINHSKESNGMVKSKPKVPPNKPSLKPPRPLPKLHFENGVKEIPSKIKSNSINGFIKAKEQVKEIIYSIQESSIKEKIAATEINQVEEVKPPEVSKVKSSFESKLTNGTIDEKTVSPNSDIPKLEKPIQEKKIDKMPDNQKVVSVKTEIVDTPVKYEPNPVKLEPKPVKLESKPVKLEPKPVTLEPKPVTLEPKPVKKLAPSPSSSSMVFDFRGKDVVPHVAVLPTPFGCKSLHPKKRPILVDGRPSPNGVASDDEDEDYVDYSVPPPSGVIFEGENIKVGRGSILSTRNKDLKIKFDDDTDSNTFVYPSESSLLEDSDRSPTSNEVIPNDMPPPTPPKLKTNTVIGTSGSGIGLSNYTPSVLRTMDNFEPGMFRPPPEKEDEKRKEEEEEENTKILEEEGNEPEMLKPADPDIISSWSLSAGTSDLLF